MNGKTMSSDTLVAAELAPVDLPKKLRHLPSAEMVVVVGVFASFCIAVLTKATKLLEPDDSAYLASIVALTHGHITLSTAQYEALSVQLSAHGGTGIMQWIHLSNGRWMSEKNPGYPFFAAPFQMLGILRAAPLFAGALASTSLMSRAIVARTLGWDLGGHPLRLLRGGNGLCLASDHAVVH